MNFQYGSGIHPRKERSRSIGKRGLFWECSRRASSDINPFSIPNLSIKEGMEDKSMRGKESLVKEFCSMFKMLDANPLSKNSLSFFYA